MHGLLFEPHELMTYVIWTPDGKGFLTSWLRESPNDDDDDTDDVDLYM